jgi:hypothetical protein
MSRYPRSMVETSEADYFREQADRCIRLSKSIDDGDAIATFRNMANIRSRPDGSTRPRARLPEAKKKGRRTGPSQIDLGPLAYS